MGMTLNKELPLPARLKEEIPLSPELAEIKAYSPGNPTGFW